MYKILLERNAKNWKHAKRKKSSSSYFFLYFSTRKTFDFFLLRCCNGPMPKRDRERKIQPAINIFLVIISEKVDYIPTKLNLQIAKITIDKSKTAHPKIYLRIVHEKQAGIPTKDPN